MSAFLLGTAIDLHTLRERLLDLGCPCFMFQGQVLHCGSSVALGQQSCSAFFLPDGAAVCWHMSRTTERFVLKLAASAPKERRRPTQFGGSITAAERIEQLGLGVPIATEELDVADAPEGVITALDPQDGSLKLTRDHMARASHQLGVSMGLAVAVRLEQMEKHIEAKLEADWRHLNSEVGSTIGVASLSGVSHRIFRAEKGLHELRYELNSVDILDVPHLLSDHAVAEGLYDQVVAHFDVRRRTTLLNDRLSYFMDYLHTLGEHVRHQYSLRLEVMIIVLIFLELLVGLISLSQGLGHGIPGTGDACQGRAATAEGTGEE